MPPHRRRSEGVPEEDPGSHIGFLDEAETPQAGKRRRARDDESLDLDKIW